MKRRSSFMPAHNASINSNFQEDSFVDEESERRNRMKLQKRQSIGHATNSAATPKTAISGGETSSISKCSQAELAKMYADCIKLSAENKISAKNAFNLNLIDYMAEVVKTKKASEMDNFQSASCALDASTKIYAYRVDSVHADTLKLAGGVGDTKDASNKNNDGQDQGDAGDGDADEEMEKKKSKRKKKAATIEKNLNNIDIHKFDLEFDVDPLFKKTSTQFDSGGGGGQFLCNLFLRDEGCQLLLDSEAHLNIQSRVLPDEDLEPLSNDEATVKIEQNSEAVICPSFSKFSFKNWSIDNEDPAFLNLSLHNDEADESLKNLDEVEEHAFDINAPPVEDVNDDNDLSGGAFGIEHDDDDNDHVPDRPQVGLGMELVANMKHRLATIPNEYSYFDDGRLGAWAGPRHWKFKPLIKAKGGQFAVPNAPKTDKKKAKDPLGPYDLDAVFQEDGDHWKVVEKTTRINKKPMQLQNKTMVNWSEDRLLLPTDLHYKGKDFASLFMTPKLLVTSKGAVVPESVDDSINEYDYDNANDADEFCPALPAIDEEDNVNGDGNYDDEMGFPDSQTILPTQTQNQTEADGLLVSAPNRVEKVQIGYAKQAKKMDMRRLKAVEWNILQTSCLEQDKENDKDVTNEAEKRQSLLSSGSSVAFSQLYKNLSESKLMPPKMTENLSVPLAFVALLHLCNERCLALDGAPDFSDFFIAQGS